MSARARLTGATRREDRAGGGSCAAAAAIGIDTLRVKRTIFLVSALGCAVAGSLWIASAITCQPRTACGANRSVFMLFTVLVGGLGRVIGPVIFFARQEPFGGFGAWYLAGVGLVAISSPCTRRAASWGCCRTGSAPNPCRCESRTSADAGAAFTPMRPG